MSLLRVVTYPWLPCGHAVRATWSSECILMENILDTGAIATSSTGSAQALLEVRIVDPLYVCPVICHDSAKSVRNQLGRGTSERSLKSSDRSVRRPCSALFGVQTTFNVQRQSAQRGNTTASKRAHMACGDDAIDPRCAP